MNFLEKRVAKIYDDTYYAHEEILRRRQKAMPEPRLTSEIRDALICHVERGVRNQGELAAAVGLDRSTLYRWLRRGRRRPMELGDEPYRELFVDIAAAAAHSISEFMVKIAESLSATENGVRFADSKEFINPELPWTMADMVADEVPELFGRPHRRSQQRVERTT